MSDRQQFNGRFLLQRSHSYDLLNYNGHKRLGHNYSLEPDYNETKERFEEEKLKLIYCMRHSEYTPLGRQLKDKLVSYPPNSLKFTVLSYNVLAQHLLEEHSYLYKNTDPEALEWERRSRRILREVKDSKADVLCLQEVQSDHFDSFFVPSLKRLGFTGIYKKRTGDKTDGCAIFYRTSKFNLMDTISVEYCKPDVKLLDRDNIGLVALLTPKVKSPGDAPFICVATTHLLYNPGRHDIKLAQLQLLFAELDHIAFKSSSESCHKYHPVILTGDFNLTPDTSIYQFITDGSLQYKGLGRGGLKTGASGQVLDNELIPPHLKVTDQCQHLHATEKRTPEKEADVSFASGQLSHQLRLQSVYPHWRQNGTIEVTTHQRAWVTVDYIFHSDSEASDSSLHLLSRTALLAADQVESLGKLPNVVSPSDHLPLIASFLWNYAKPS